MWNLLRGGGIDPLQALVDQARPPVREDDDDDEPDSEFERVLAAGVFLRRTL